MNFPPVCLFPTTTVLLDDDEDFLSSLCSRLNLPGHTLRCFNNPEPARKFLVENATRSWSPEWLAIKPSEDGFENITVEFQIPKIAESFFEQRSFNNVTTIIVDYKMPACNGLQFLEGLAEVPAKKILLTNVANADIAVDAFAKRLIDGYVKKHDENVLIKLRAIIEDNHLNFFRERSSFIGRPLNIFVTEHQGALRAYCELVNAIRSYHQATEFYLTDPNGSYAFFNDAGEKADLIIKTKEQLEAEFDAVREHLSETQMFGKLERFEAMLVYPDSPETSLDLTPLNDEQTLFYALNKNDFTCSAQR